MAATNQFTVSATAPTAVIVQSDCMQVRIAENRGVSGYPTSDFLISKPLSTSPQVRVQAGAQYTFVSNRRPMVSPSGFRAGQTVGYVRMVSGTTTFDQDEDDL